MYVNAHVSRYSYPQWGTKCSSSQAEAKEGRWHIDVCFTGEFLECLVVEWDQSNVIKLLSCGAIIQSQSGRQIPSLHLVE